MLRSTMKVTSSVGCRRRRTSSAAAPSVSRSPCSSSSSAAASERRPDDRSVTAVRRRRRTRSCESARRRCAVAGRAGHARPTTGHDRRHALPVVRLSMPDDRPQQGLTAAPCEDRPRDSVPRRARRWPAPGGRARRGPAVLGREAVLELVEVVVEIGRAEVVELSRRRRRLERMGGAAVARGDQRRLDGARLVGASSRNSAPHGADRVHHRQAGDQAPFLAQVIAVRVDAGAQDVQRLVADQQQAAEVGQRLGERTLPGADTKARCPIRGTGP